MPFHGIHPKNRNKHVYKDIYTRLCTEAQLKIVEMESTCLSKKEYLSKLWNMNSMHLIRCINIYHINS